MIRSLKHLLSFRNLAFVLFATTFVITLGIGDTQHSVQAGWPHHSRHLHCNPGRWPTPLAYTHGYPRSTITLNRSCLTPWPVVDHRFNYGPYWRVAYGPIHTDRWHCGIQRRHYVPTYNCLPTYYWPSYCLPSSYYFGAYPIWYSSGIYFSANGSNWNQWNAAALPQPFQVAARGGQAGNQLLAANAANRLAQARLAQANGVVTAARGSRQPLTASQFDRAPRIADATLRNLDHNSGNRTITSWYGSNRSSEISSLEDRVAQTHEIMSRTYNATERLFGNPIASRTSSLSTIDRVALSEPSRRTLTGISNRSTSYYSVTSRMEDGDNALREGSYHTAEIWFRQAGREQPHRKQEAALKIAASQFAQGDFDRAAITLRWLAEQTAAQTSDTNTTENLVSQWSKELTGEPLSTLFSDPVAYERKLNQLAQVALDQDDNDSELWLLGIIVGLDGQADRSRLFLTQAASVGSEFSPTAAFALNPSQPNQSRLRLAAQTLRSP